MRNPKAIASVFSLVFVALAWGTSYAIIKDVIGSLPPFTLMLFRFGFSTLILTVLYGHRLKTITVRHVRNSAWIGLFLILEYICQILGIRHTTASNQSFLVGACVIFVPFLAWFLSGQRPDGFALGGALLAALGIGLLTLHGSLSMNKGDLLSLLASVFVACHMVAIERLGRNGDPVASTLIQFFVTSVAFLILTGCYESFTFALTPKHWKALAYLVVVTTVLAFTLQNIAQKHLSSTSTALVLALEPAFGGLFAVLYLKEMLTLRMAVGCLMILAGIVMEETGLRFLHRRAGGIGSPSQT
jgi:drug/metabolite transporter (DMT)-like permease